MDYVIATPNKKIYLKLDQKGSPEICGKEQKQKFEYSKARNILDNLPRNLKKFHFSVIAILDFEKEEVVNKEEIIVSKYEIPEEIKEWERRVKDFNNLIEDASKRKKELLKALVNIEKEECNCLHKIELNKNLGVCDGYKEYKELRTILRKRRKIKDELMIIDCILKSSPLKEIEKNVKALRNRVYTLRKIEK